MEEFKVIAGERDRAEFLSEQTFLLPRIIHKSQNRLVSRGDVVAARSVYDADYVRYFTGTTARLFPINALWYTKGVVYNPTSHEILVGCLRNAAVTVRLRSALPVRTTFYRGKTLHSAFDDVGKGLVNLNRDRLSLNGQATKASASWIPDMSWYASQERALPALFPECKAPDIADCGFWYSIETTSAVQAALWASQNPANCNSALYLVLSEPWPSGLGSLLHIHMFILAVAVRYGR